MVKFTIIVPVHNEEGNLRILHDEITNVMNNMGSYKIIYVNDGSTDRSLKILKTFKDSVIINLQRNYGQSAALDAGFKYAESEYIISIDADLQNDPRDIPRLFRKMQDKGLDVIAGWRFKRKDPLYVKVLTRISRMMRKFVINDYVHDSGCTLRIYKKDAIKTLDLWGEMHRYIVALLKWKGFRIGELKVKHRPRYKGKTHYDAIKALKGFIDLIFVWFIDKYSRRPLHLFGTLSFILFGVGGLMEAIMLFLKIKYNSSLSDNGFFMLGLFFILMGIQLFVSGLIIDIMLRNFYNTSHVEKRYIIKQILNT